jgi:Protein of unknown function (DUF3995)
VLPETVLHRSAVVAAGLAFASAAVTAYWTLGGTALLDTVGGYAEDLARTGGPLAVLVGILVVAVKVVGGLVALGLTHLGRGRKLHRPLLLAGGLGSVLLIIYGGLLVAGGALVLTGILQPAGPVDRRALTWHVLLWDLWFLLWGLALAATTWRSNRSSRLVT